MVVRERAEYRGIKSLKLWLRRRDVHTRDHRDIHNIAAIAVHLGTIRQPIFGRSSHGRNSQSAGLEL